MDKAAFLDAHLHLWEFCLFNYFTSLEDVPDLDRMTDKMRSGQVNGWMVGVRFNQENLADKRIPDRYELDRRFGSCPAVIIRTCLHLVIMNTAAMRILNYSSPDGIFLEADVFSILNRLTMEVGFDSDDIVKNGTAILQGYGITRVIDMAMNPYKKSLLPAVDYYTTDFGLLDEALGFKVFLDGSFGARTAALAEEYADDPGNYGQLNYSDPDLLDLVLKIHRRNKPISFHAIGDRALAQFLRITKQSRHLLDRIEHVQFAYDDQLDELAALDVPVCIQPIFSSEIPWAKNRLGDQRISKAYAWNLMQEKGIFLLAGSDAPVDAADPRLAASVVDAQSGDQHLDYDQVLKLFAENNWRFYGWEKPR